MYEYSAHHAPILNERDDAHRAAANRKGYIVVESERTGRTTKKGVCAGGDIVTGAATVILAAVAGRFAGMAIDQFLKGGEWWDPNAP